MAKKKQNTEENENQKKYVTLGKCAEAEFTERKSLFIGNAKPVKSEEEAIAFIHEIRSRYSDATHNVYGYMIGANITRFSDDGEPSGTAGMPVLDVIRKSGFTDAVIVVTRYFGGILLGAGGLVRAYSAAAKAAVDAAGIVTYEPFIEFTLKCTYSDYQKLEREIEFFSCKKEGSDFASDITLKLAMKKTSYPDFLTIRA